MIAMGDIPINLSIDNLGALRMAILAHSVDGDAVLLQSPGGILEKEIRAAELRGRADNVDFDDRDLDPDSAQRAIAHALLNGEPEILLKGWRNGLTVGIQSHDNNSVHWIKRVPWDVINRMYQHYRKCRVSL